LIDDVNKQLMLLTMQDCYARLQGNAKEIEEISKWIDEFRVELKKNVIRKQDKELANHRLYSYMHDIFGTEVIDIFDMQYIPSGLKKPEIQGEKMVK
jgi:type I site-specific restriction endonuclease